VTVRETVNATKERFGEDALAELFEGASKIIVAKGKKVRVFAPAKDELADIAAVALGPTGNLRAPAIRTGKTWLIGFNEEAYGSRFD
jgi:arsenate reductase-like glutaredoxin family protein